MFKLIIFTLLFGFFFFSCANMVAPVGGPVDNEPPKVQKILPSNESINFNEKVIVVSFDEYVQLKEVKQIVVTPNIENISFKAKGKKVRVLLPDSLPQNATIAINFNNQIVDYREGNALSDFRYVFSTGSFIDSLSINGSITDAVSKMPIENMLVGLYHTFEDSVFNKQKPIYFAKTNASGDFSLLNLPNKQFYLIAFKDSNSNLLFNGGEMLAFTNQLMQPKPVSDSSNNLYLNAFRTEPIYNRIVDIRAVDSMHIKCKLASPPLTSLDIYLNQNKIINNYFVNHDSLLIVSESGFNSDSVNIRIVEKGYFEANKTIPTNKRKPIERQVNNITLSKSTNLPVLLLNLPHKPDTGMLHVSLNDTILACSLEPISILEWNIKAPFENGKTYKISYINSFVNGKNDTLRFSYQPKLKNELGHLILSSIDSIFNLGYGVQVIAENNRIIYNLNKQNPLKEELFLAPGKYQIRVYADNNNNGFLDTGNLKQNRQPELAYNLAKPIEIRADWEISVSWDDFNLPK